MSPSSTPVRWTEITGVILVLLLMTLVFLSPAPRHLTTRTIGGGDAYQTVWNFWWFHRTILEEPGPLFFTKHLFHPIGAYLYFHTHGYLNAVAALPLTELLGPLPAYNVMVILTFLATGLLMYLLLRRQTDDPLASLAAACIFTLSPYRIGHTTGHLNLISTQWFPLLAMAVPWAVPGKGWRRLLAVALLLLLVPFTSYYYFIYGLLLVVLLAADLILRAESLPEQRRRFWRSLTIPSLATALFAPFAYLMFRSVRLRPIAGGHDAVDFSADLLSFVIPGPHSMYRDWFLEIRDNWSGNQVEQSSYLGILPILLFLLALAVLRRRDLRIWKIMVPLGMLLALGPTLHVNGRLLPGIPLPYQLLRAIPPLSMGGVPARYVLFALLGLSVLIGHLLAAGRRRFGRWGTALTLGVAVVTLAEYFPGPFPAQQLDQPRIFEEIAREEGDFAILDTREPVDAMYGQTIHGKPIIGGYLSRRPLEATRFVQQTPVVMDLLFGEPEVWPALERNDGPIQFNWSQGGPAPYIPGDEFQVTWKGEVHIPRSGAYTFRTHSDDGVRLRVDGRLIIDDWVAHAPESHFATVHLEEGWVPLILEYQELYGYALCELWWVPPGGEEEILPRGSLRTPTGEEGLEGVYWTESKHIRGWRAISGYYLVDTNDLDGLAVGYFPEPVGGVADPRWRHSRIPGLHPEMAPTPDSGPVMVSWRGSIQAPVHGEYGFRVHASAPVRLLIDGWPLLEGSIQEAEVELAAGPHDFSMEMEWRTDDPTFDLEWRMPELDGRALLCHHRIRYVCTHDPDDIIPLAVELGLELAAREEPWYVYRVSCP